MDIGADQIGYRTRKRSTSRVKVCHGKWLGCQPRRHWCHEERHDVHDTREVEPEAEKVVVSQHTISRFMARFPMVMDRSAAVQAIKATVVHGRRSDRDHRLVREIRQWLDRASLRHYGRSVTIFMDPATRLCVLAVIDRECFDVLATLTCFVAQDQQLELEEQEMVQLPATDAAAPAQPSRTVRINLQDLRRRITFGLPLSRDESHWLVEQASGPLERHPVRCLSCNATGKSSGEKCPWCGGTGYIPAPPVVYEVQTGSAT